MFADCFKDSTIQLVGLGAFPGVVPKVLPGPGNDGGFRRVDCHLLVDFGIRETLPLSPESTFKDKNMITKSIFVLALGAFALTAIPIASAQPPSQLGDTFVNTTVNAPAGAFAGYTTTMYYLGRDGSCIRLNQLTFSGGVYTYGATETGTFTYAPPSGNPSEALLTIVLPDSSGGFKLAFTSDTSGSIDFGSGPTSGVQPNSGTFSISLATPNQFLVNVSNRVTLGPTDTAITGFVIGGTATRMVLIRTVGPSLSQFGVTAPAPNPTLSVYSGNTIFAVGLPEDATGVGYDAKALNFISNLVGAFPLTPGSNDVVYFSPLTPGAYTVQATDQNQGPGSVAAPTTAVTALVEVYILPYSG